MLKKSVYCKHKIIFHSDMFRSSGTNVQEKDIKTSSIKTRCYIWMAIIWKSPPSTIKSLLPME